MSPTESTCEGDPRPLIGDESRREIAARIGVREPVVADGWSIPAFELTQRIYALASGFGLGA